MGNEADAESPLAAAVRLIGSQSAFARLIGRSQPLIHDWLKRATPLPAEHVLKVEEATGISRHDLRPDLYPREAAAPPAPRRDDTLGTMAHAR